MRPGRDCTREEERRRAAALRARRAQQARSLGHLGLKDFYRGRYHDQHAGWTSWPPTSGTASDLIARGRTARAGKPAR